MSLSLPTQTGATSNVKSRFSYFLHSFGWFFCGILSVVIFLQIQGTISLPQSFQLPGLATSDPESHHGRPHQRPNAKPSGQVQDSVQGRTWDSFTQAFTFGDSYTSLWFNPGKKQPFRQDPFGNRQHGNPPNWVQYLTRTHNATFLRTYDFAVGGSTVDRELVQPYLMGSTFKEQVHQQFQPYYTGDQVRARWDPAKTLFFMWFGVNDLFLPRGRGDAPAPVTEIMESFEKTSEDLISYGAKHLIFLTVPPFERATDLSVEEKAEVTPLITSMNSRIFEMRTRLRNNHPDIDVAIFDSHLFYVRVIDGPADFEETKTVKYPDRICKSPPEDSPFPEKSPHEAKCAEGLVREYLWYGLHPTFPMNNATAKHITTDCFGLRGRSGYCS